MQQRLLVDYAMCRRAMYGRVSRRSIGESGFTLIEVVLAVGVWSIFLVSIMTAVLGTQNGFVQSQTVTQLRVRAQHAMDRIVSTCNQAVTGDTEFSPLKPTTGVQSHCLRFRLIQFVDGTGTPVYEDTLRVYVYGMDTGSTPCNGIILGRGPDLATIHSTGSGPDGVLGTTDDDATSSIAGGVPAVELLVPSTFAPQSGDMLTIDVTPPPIGRLLTITMRLNVRGADGNFLLPNDLVLTERVALRQ